MLQLAGGILLTVLAPIMLLVGLGALLRWKLRLDVSTLSKLNIYLLVPAFVFENVSTSTLSLPDMAGVFGITVLQVITLGIIVWGIGRLLRVSRKTLAAVALAVMFYNSGNYGLPLAELAYPKDEVRRMKDEPGGGGSENREASSEEGRTTSSATANWQLTTGNSTDSSFIPHRSSLVRDGATYQTFVMMAQNLLTFTVGMAIAAAAHTGGVGAGFKKLMRLPVLPTLAAAIAAQWWLKSDPSHSLPLAITKTATYLKNAMVPMALMTLGAQLATNPRWPRWKPVSLVLMLRLVFGPVQMGLMLYLLHCSGIPSLDVWPWPAELLILTASVPTAVNTLLLTLELGGDAELAADCVFWTTVFSVISITVWLVVLRSSAWLH